MTASLKRAAAAALAITTALGVSSVKPQKARAGDDDARAVAQAKAALAGDLLARLPGDGNLFFSPESIAVALGMTASGARGKTLDAFEKTLHVPAGLGWERFHAALGGKAREDGEGFTLRQANRLFGQRGFAFRAAFKDGIAKAYRGGLEEVDFRTDAPGARKTINEWVSKETAAKIPSLLPEGKPTPDSRLVLVNAVYFKATWEEKFEARWTKDAPFKLSGGTTKTVKLMQRAGHWDFGQDDAAQFVAIPYQGGRFEAVFLLPKGDAPSLSKKLTGDRLAKLRDGAKNTFVFVKLPRFKFEWTQDLSPELKALGLEPAFSAGTADFSGIADEPKEPLFIASVIHKAIVALDENGTEAAAATAVDMAAGGVPPKPIELVFDRPFLFLIRDKASGAILFLGRVADPTG